MALEYETTLENFKGYTPGRRMGNTTRLVDHAIQIIFSGKKCVVIDHHQQGDHKQENKRLFRVIMDRIKREHPHLFSSGELKYDFSSCIIWLEKHSNEDKPPIYFGFK